MKPFHILPFLLLTALPLHAADAPTTLLRNPPDFFKTEPAKQIADNILTYQGIGADKVMAWPKAYDTTIPYPGNLVKNDKGDKISWEGVATIDNGSTYSELQILAKVISAEPDGPRSAKWKDGFYKGLDAVLAQQYKNGGWPQRFPPTAKNQNDYATHITFNDSAISSVLTVLKAVAAGEAPYAFVDAGHRKAAQAAFDKGVDCILNCQIKVDGKLTAWCAQHDENTLAPAQGRAYEPPSISGWESASIAVLLMSIEHPSDRVKAAIRGAYEWYDRTRIPDKAFRNFTDAEGLPDRKLVDSPGNNAWARFYDIATSKPIFEGRDSVIRNSLAEIERERRTGYQWYGPWGKPVLEGYPKWSQQNP